MQSAAPFLFEAHWWPVMLETVPGSGEALTVAVVVRAASGQATVRQAIPPATLLGMFGSAGKGMMLIVGNTVLDIHRQLDNAVQVEQLDMPFGGLQLGPGRECAARDLNQIFDIAMRMGSAFSISNFGVSDQETPDKEARKAFEEWVEKVQASVAVLAQFDKLAAAFNVQVPLTHRKKTRLGFVYGGYVAQFGVLRPGRSVSADVKALKVKLFDLEVLRRERPLQFSRAEIIVGYQDAGDTYTRRQNDALNESWSFVASEATERNVVAHRFTTSAQAANHLAEVAQAA